jgi:creatinine amidohydrolase
MARGHGANHRFWPVVARTGGEMRIANARILAASLTIAVFCGQAYSASLDNQQANRALAPDARVDSNKHLPRRYWQEMTTEEFAALDTDQVIAVLPIASIEQHGPHLPVCTDACANQAVIERTLELLPEDLPVTVLPMMPVGKANEHSAFPGTLSLSSETVQHLWTEIAESVHRAGIRKLVFFNSHGGNRRILPVVAREIRERLDMLVIITNLSSDAPGNLFPAEERRYGIHGGSVETSRMLYLRPDLVNMSKAENFHSTMADLAKEFQQLPRTATIAWQAQDLNPAGVVGNARDADAERGRQLIEHAATQFAAVLTEVDRLPLSHLRCNFQPSE